MTMLRSHYSKDQKGVIVKWPSFIEERRDRRLQKNVEKEAGSKTTPLESAMVYLSAGFSAVESKKFLLAAKYFEAAESEYEKLSIDYLLFATKTGTLEKDKILKRMFDQVLFTLDIENANVESNQDQTWEEMESSKFRYLASECNDIAINARLAHLFQFRELTDIVTNKIRGLKVLIAPFYEGESGKKRNEEISFLGLALRE